VLHAEQHDFKDLQMFLQVFAYATMHASSNNSEFVKGNIRVPAELSAYLRCHSAPVLSRALPSAASRAAQPYDSTSAPWHGANNRPKGHCGPSACKNNQGHFGKTAFDLDPFCPGSVKSFEKSRAFHENGK
jgi:hypothetical protein